MAFPPPVGFMRHSFFSFFMAVNEMSDLLPHGGVLSGKSFLISSLSLSGPHCAWHIASTLVHRWPTVAALPGMLLGRDK